MRALKGRFVGRLFVSVLTAALTIVGGSAAAQQTSYELADLERIADSDTMVMVPMRDGVRLATDIYRPKDAEGKLPLIFIKTPYDFNEFGGSSLQWAYQAIERGYAVAVQNERGRYYSEGEWEILGNPRTDGYDALTWFADQEWSNGAVGTLGCSSSAEWQMALAAQSHPAHKAMVPMAAGAGIGRVGEFYEQGNWYKGGVHQTLFTVWLYSVQQQVYPRFAEGTSQEDLQRFRKLYDLAPDMPEVDWKKQLRKLPSIDWLEDAGGNFGPMQDMMARTPDHEDWYEGGLYHDDEAFGVPAFWFNSWFDVSQGPNLALFNHARENGSTRAVRDGQYVLIAPTLHCGFYRISEHEDYIAGDLNVGNPSFPLYDQLFGFFDYYLRGEKNDTLDDMPRVQYYTMGENEWNSSESWPPAEAASLTLYFDSEGSANSLFGDGVLRDTTASGTSSDTFTYDPMNPVPALGGGVCCNADAALGGSFDQRGIEARADVLVYTTDPLEEDIEVTAACVQPCTFLRTRRTRTSRSSWWTCTRTVPPITWMTRFSEPAIGKATTNRSSCGTVRSTSSSRRQCRRAISSKPATAFASRCHRANFRSTCATSTRAATTTMKRKGWSRRTACTIRRDTRRRLCCRWCLSLDWNAVPRWSRLKALLRQ